MHDEVRRYVHKSLKTAPVKSITTCAAVVKKAQNHALHTHTNAPAVPRQAGPERDPTLKNDEGNPDLLTLQMDSQDPDPAVSLRHAAA
ncbi:hypothetical protein NHX12_007581 [Muraenolepis orangiensis]|uniref:Uncharacterized protein n=1 Tax=Muraenolepis orangiensis TaxID=630683 RepID=A0A9Q0DQ44_9TELE|nr:hypothetical protein NHX12_007581 [Muraenolepis orangiensis]